MEEHLTNWSLTLLVGYCVYLLPCTSLSIYYQINVKIILKLLLLIEVSNVLTLSLHEKGITEVSRDPTGVIKWAMDYDLRK